MWAGSLIFFFQSGGFSPTVSLTNFLDSLRPGAWGERPYALIDWVGPASYTSVVNGVAPNTPSGGQAIGPSNFNFSASLEGIFVVGASLSGAYIVQAMQVTAYSQAFGNTTWILRWITAATGVEVASGVKLSSEIVRLIGFGPY